MSKELEDTKSQSYEGRMFDEPLILPGHIDSEPERYIAEKPFDLTRFEYSILRKSNAVDFRFALVSGATAGVVLSVICKSIAALIAKQNPTLEIWEVIAVIVGGILSYMLKCKLKSEEDKEKYKLISVIDNHFEQNKPRHLHLTKGGRDES
ncbi:hypothetical protein ACFFLG_02325 [Shewanella indica]|uniref:hypothetical protein n=1 Tax=Shewanella TaxID=22 RepID=UPI000C32A1EE|nr:MULTISPECIES: hypothetical protein [Shewanella]MCE9788563.1 hypothetical protein [Shewanella chilikensis]GHB00523.1 hypothetical protein GCM10007107_11670 [Shewanella indica]